jgi:phosphatidylglycerol lysyltransferase
LFAAALYALHQLTVSITAADLINDIRNTTATQLILALLLTAASYSVLTLYDRLALRYLGLDITPRASAPIAFTAYAMSHTIGFSAISGGAVRYRGYSSLGLTTSQIAAIIGFATFTFALGGTLLLGFALLLEPAYLFERIHIAPSTARVAAVFCLALPATYLMWSIFGTRPLQLRNWQVNKPTAGMACAQIAVAAVDLTLACAVVFALLPDNLTINFAEFLGAYLVAMGAGVVSGVPGGAGVFESLLLLLVPEVPTSQALGALLLFRVAYYLLPLVIAVTILLTNEVRLRRHLMAGVRENVSLWMHRLVPALLAPLVFLCGTVLLVSGSMPQLSDRLHVLQTFVPPLFIELSHLLNSVAGVVLIVIARSLAARTKVAFNATLILLCVGILVSLLKGLDWEEAFILTLVAVLLLPFRSQFDRPSVLLDQTYSIGWILSIVAVLLGMSWLTYLTLRHHELTSEFWWRFAIDADTSRIARATALALITGLCLGLLRLFRPQPVKQPRPDPEELLAIIGQAENTLANVVLLNDKEVIRSATGRSFIMYQYSGSSCIALGDPVGDVSEYQDMVWSFRDLCERARRTPVFYQVSAHHLPLYLDSGFSLEKLGEEAIIPLTGFDLTGSQRAALRQSRNRLSKQGAQFAVIARQDYATIADQIEAVSNEWLADKAGAEKGFSLGYFDHNYLKHFDVAVIHLADEIVAFANLWRAGTHELSIDLMRFGHKAPKGVMDFLIVELLLWGAAQGFTQFNLGMAPLSGLETHDKAPLWHKTGNLFYQRGNAFYGFEGLRQFKDKFDPTWEPRYLATPAGFQLPKVLLDTTLLISGGFSGILGYR